jgi:hypothetical protein
VGKKQWGKTKSYDKSGFFSAEESKLKPIGDQTNLNEKAPLKSLFTAPLPSF